MGRYLGPVCKLCRREGQKLFLKGQRCLSPKCALEKRNFPPGMHRSSSQRRLTDYGRHLRAKQIAKRMYNLLEKPFKKLFFEAQAQAGQTGENLVKLLERRLDNVIYRGRLTSSRRHARQLITHGFVQVNNRKVDIPSYRIKQGDVIKLIEKAKDIPIVKETLEQGHSEELPAWLELDFNKLTLTVVRLPEAEEIKVPFEPQLIVEFYSR